MRAILTLKSLALALVLTLTGVAAQAESDFVPRMAEPIVVNPEKIVAEGKRPVLIWYACETRDAEDFQPTIERLEKVDKERARKLAERVEEDVRGFSKIVDMEAETLLREVRQCKSESGMAAAVFTTRDSRDGFFRYVSSDENQVRRPEFRLPKFKSEGYRTYPLSHPRVFQAALEKVASVFDPQSHTFILVTKAHGGEDYAMTGLTGKLSAESQAELAECVAESPSVGERLNEEDGIGYDDEGIIGFDNEGHIGYDNEGHIGYDDIGHIGFDDIGHIGYDNDGILGFDDEGYIGAIAPKFGTKKDKYFSIVEKCGMDFQAVFVEACHSQLPAELAKQLPKNIGRVYTSETGLKYQNLDWDKLLADCQSGMAPKDALDQQLDGETE